MKRYLCSVTAIGRNKIAIFGGITPNFAAQWDVKASNDCMIYDTEKNKLVQSSSGEGNFSFACTSQMFFVGRERFLTIASEDGR